MAFGLIRPLYISRQTFLDDAFPRTPFSLICERVLRVSASNREIRESKTILHVESKLGDVEYSMVISIASKLRQ